MRTDRLSANCQHSSNFTNTWTEIILPWGGHPNTKWNKISDVVLIVQYDAPRTLKQATRNKLEKFEKLKLGELCREIGRKQ